MKNLSCKLPIPLGPSTRDPSLEADLQARLDDGHRLFAIGDVHGHLATLRALLHRLRLGPEDRVILLGDAIDRGPNSAGVVDLLRSHPNLIAIKGNHEHMAVQSIRTDGTFEAWGPWMRRGGKSTYGSYIVQAEGDLHRAKAKMVDDFAWLDSLPTQIVLDRHRFVHAGYDPRMPLDMQGEKELLWIRKVWYDHDAPVDPNRAVFFGHTTTTKLGDAPGEPAFADHRLNDGRPSWTCMDVGAYNHVAPGIAAIDVSTYRITKQPTLRCDRWFERPEHRSTKRKGSGCWQASDNRKEAHVAESFGLKALANRARRTSIAEERARRELAEAGLVAAQADGPNPPTLTRHARTPSFHGGTEDRTHLPGPTGFRVYRRKPTSFNRPLHHAALPTIGKAQ